ncbi:hypothetical protein [Candidatus Poriferisodalis sp.]|uniref:hypothetical protein n=1 Tax=Candidatus Poriferisodalis sp. TaxID=3101277 RepID=UPI003B02E8B3
MAVTITAVELAVAAGLPVVADPDTDDDVDERTSPVGTRLLSVATAVVERYAPDAPSELQNESVIRFCAYLGAATPTPNAAGSISIGDLGPITSSPHSHARAFTLSGAAMLLTRYRKRRAGKAT